MRSNDEVLQYIPAEIIDIIAACTSSFKVDKTLYKVVVFKNRLKFACLNRQQLALYESDYRDERVYHLLCEMVVIGKFHYNEEFTRHFVDIAFINARYYDMIKKLVMTLDRDREPDVSSFLCQMVLNPDAYAIRGYDGGAKSAMRKNILNTIKQNESNADHSLGIDLYFAFIRLAKYGEREPLGIKLVDHKSSAKYDQLFVHFEDNPYDVPPQTARIENDRKDVDLCCLWPLMVGRMTLCNQPKIYAIEKYPRWMLARFYDLVCPRDTHDIYRIICENATKIRKNEDVLRHFYSKLDLYDTFILEKKKIEKERRNQLRLEKERLAEEARKQRIRELNQVLLMKESEQVGRIYETQKRRFIEETRCIAKELDPYYDMPSLVPNDELALEPLTTKMVMPTADGMIILVKKLAHLKRVGIVEYYEFKQSGELAVVLTNDIYTKEVLSFLNV